MTTCVSFLRSGLQYHGIQLHLDGTGIYGEIQVTGELHSPRDAVELQHAAVALYARHGCRLVLIDVTQAQVVSGTLPALEAANQKGAFGRQLHLLRVALLYPQITEHERFFETISINRGLTIKIFDTRDAARAWLLQPGETGDRA